MEVRALGNALPSEIGAVYVRLSFWSLSPYLTLTATHGKYKATSKLRISFKAKNFLSTVYGS